MSSSFDEAIEFVCGMTITMTMNRFVAFKPFLEKNVFF